MQQRPETPLLDQFRDNGYYFVNGNNYGPLSSVLISVYFLDLCCCSIDGQIDNNVRHVLDVMKIIDDEISIDERNEKLLDVFKTNQNMNFFMIWLSMQGFIDHFQNINEDLPLTSEGLYVLELLLEWEKVYQIERQEVEAMRHVH